MKKFVCPQFRTLPACAGRRDFRRVFGTFVILVLLTPLVYHLASNVSPARAAVCGEDVPTDPGSLTTYIADCNAKLSDISGQKQTLASALSYLNTQIKLTQAKIATTTTQLDKLNVEIADLSTRIESIDYSLTDLTKLFISRVRESYMRRNTYDAEFIAQSSGLSGILRGIEYTKKIRDHDRTILISLEKSRLDASAQKETKELKQKEIATLKLKLDSEKKALNSQIASKNNLLAETKNSEAKYQSLLSQALAELEAINDIIAGKGSETEVGTVAAGQRIASIIQGESCNSSAAHLHFIVSQNGTTHNPFSYLSGIDHDNCSGSSCESGDGDAFNPSGSWPWPTSPRIKFTQGYGNTWAVRNTWVGRIYSFHNGIDFNSSASEVRAVATGTLYRGSYSGHNRCNLRYVRVDHLDSDLDTFYLHITY